MISPISARPRPTRAAHSVASPVPAPCDCISMGPPFPRSVSHTLADREPPATARESLPEAIADGELRYVAADGARRAEAQRHAEVPSQPRRLVRVPGTTVVEERRDTHAHQPPHVVRHQHPILDGKPGHAGTRELVDRSEEHTSELQSLAYLVCRLLLEKKKKKRGETGGE